MHIGGALAKEVVRSDDPSAFGQGVSPVMVAPGATDTAVGLADGIVVAAVEFLSSLLPTVRASSTATATRPTMAPPTFRPVFVAFLRRSMWYICSSRACRLAFCRSLLAVPTVGRH